MFSSCSIEKRQYRSGYHVEWKNKAKTQDSNNEKIEDVVFKSESSENNVIVEELAVVKSTPVNQPIVKAENITQAVVETPVVREESHSVLKATTTPMDVVQGQGEETVVSIGKSQTTVSKANSNGNAPMSKPSKGLLIFLAIVIPWLAVGLVTDWSISVVWNLLWSLTCIGGIIHAIIVVNREY